MRRLFYDLETSPALVYSWRVGYRIRIDYQNIVSERAVICVGYRWQDEDVTRVLRWDKNQCDKSMLEKFSKVLSCADECVGHNIDRFDWPWLRTRALFHGLPPLPQVKTADTLQWARRYHYFQSNRLNYIATFLGIGHKKKVEFDLWKQVLAGSKKALAKMSDYCARDVELLEKVYERLAVWCPVKTHAGVLSGHEKWTCPRCASDQVVAWGRYVTSQGTEQHRMRCHTCGGSYRISKTAKEQFNERNK